MEQQCYGCFSIKFEWCKKKRKAWILWPLCLQPPMGEEGGRRRCPSSSAGDEGRRRRHPSNSTSKPTQPSKASSSAQNAPKDNAQKTAAQGKKNESAAGGKKESVNKWSPPAREDVKQEQIGVWLFSPADRQPGERLPGHGLTSFDF